MEFAGVSFSGRNPTVVSSRPGILLSHLLLDQLAFSIYAGHAILSKRRGREALGQLGEAVVKEWAVKGDFVFRGDSDLIPTYVSEFLRSVQNDFPNIVIDDGIENMDVVAQFRRMPINIWDGNFWNFPPKEIGGLFFNRAVRYSLTGSLHTHIYLVALSLPLP